MSEYQYYEWQTVDRLLTPEEQAAVNSLSSHIEVSASRAEVIYNWSDFRHDPTEVLLKYFDGFFYMANWGSRQLMFRFPSGLLDPAEIARYCDGEGVTFKTYDRYQVLNIEFHPGEGGWIDEDHETLSDFIQLRSDLLEGDYRVLYLAWLARAAYEPGEYAGEDADEEEDEYEEEYEEESEGEPVSEVEGETGSDYEPPVPPGLKKLTPALENFIQSFGIDPFLVRAAAETSGDLSAPLAADYRELVAGLPRAECDDFLTRLAEGDPGVRLDLRRRLKEFLPARARATEASAQAIPRSIQELIDRAEELENAAKQRQAETDRLKHVAEMKALAQREPEAWQQVAQILQNGPKTAATYDEATRRLDKLKQLADFQDTRDLFFSRVKRLAEIYTPGRPSLLRRWQGQGWTK